MVATEQHRLTFEHQAEPGLVSVVIPVRDDAAGLRDTLQSVVRYPTALPYEIIVANDGADRAVSDVCRDYAVVQEVALSPNRGPGAARNAALRQSRGEFVAFLDADVVITPGWWSALGTASRCWDFVGGRVDIDPEKVKTMAHRYDAISAFDVEGFIARHHAATCNLLVRRALLERVGGFDERFRSGEDTEFGKRAYGLGASMGYSDEMAILHPPRGGSAQRKKLYRIVMGRLELAQALPQRFGGYRLTPRVAVSLALPPRRLTHDRQAIQGASPSTIAALYLMRYASNLYTLGAYAWLTISGTAGKQHDLS